MKHNQVASARMLFSCRAKVPAQKMRYHLPKNPEGYIRRLSSWRLLNSQMQHCCNNSHFINTYQPILIRQSLLLIRTALFIITGAVSSIIKVKAYQVHCRHQDENMINMKQMNLFVEDHGGQDSPTAPQQKRDPLMGGFASGI